MCEILSHISPIFQDKNANFLKLNLQNKAKNEIVLNNFSESFSFITYKPLCMI